MRKSYEREGEKEKQEYRENINIFSITERKILAYRYFCRMSDEERQSDVEITSRVFYGILFNNNMHEKITRF